MKFHQKRSAELQNRTSVEGWFRFRLEAWDFALRTATPQVAFGFRLRSSSYDGTRRPDKSPNLFFS